MGRDPDKRRDRIESQMDGEDEHDSFVQELRLFGIGFITFFFTGLDDTIAYSFLLTGQAAIIGFSADILVATGVDLLLVFSSRTGCGNFRTPVPLGVSR